jgi:nitroreductase
MSGATSDVWEAMSTARTIRRFTDEPVDDATLERCLQAAMWAPSGANAQAWRFVVLRSPQQRAVVAKAAARALEVIEPVYGMSRPADDDHSRRARTNRATYELHERAGEFTSVLFAQKHFPTASELLLGGSIFPAMQNFLLAARAQGLGACLTSWGAYGGEQLLRDAVGVPEDWMLAGHIVVGWPKGRHGPVRRRPLGEVVNLDHWDEPAAEFVANAPRQLLMPTVIRSEMARVHSGRRTRCWVSTVNPASSNSRRISADDGLCAGAHLLVDGPCSSGLRALSVDTATRPPGDSTRWNSRSAAGWSKK